MLKEALRTCCEKEEGNPSHRLLVFKLPYHPRGIQKRHIRRAYVDSGLEKLLPNRRLICAQLKAPNLRDRVCRTALKEVNNANPSDYLATNPE